jgi:hypothetical protein
MWAATVFGWFSIVRKQDGFHVRARQRQDLASLCKKAGIAEEKISTWPSADYRFRVVLDKDEYIAVMATLTDAVDYDNFKNKIGSLREQRDKLSPYIRIWSEMYEYQESR